MFLKVRLEEVQDNSRLPTTCFHMAMQEKKALSSRGRGRLRGFLVSQACQAMEMGASAVMINTAIATAGDIPQMAAAFREAVSAGRKAYLSGLGRVSDFGSASSPLTGFLRD